MIETVDSFQGKQLDVVILSCVRASADTGARRSVGFVSDLRRLNVVRAAHAVMAACETVDCRGRCAGLGDIGPV
jgi:AAA domain